MIAVPNFVSVDEYVEIERHSQIRHEYRRGLVYAMAEGSDNHDRIALNLLSIVNLNLGDSDCRFYSSNVKVNDEREFYYCPDAFVTCDPRDRQDRDVKRHPKLIVEVLAPSTQAFDVWDKFQDYQKLSSLQEYVLISQDSQQVECRRRTATNMWTTTVYNAGDEVMLDSVNLRFAIGELYRGVDR